MTTDTNRKHMYIPAPIILFVYNRPEHTLRTVQALKNNKGATESELFIFSDGPKDDDQSKQKVAEVRALIRDISGFKKLTIIERQQNRGLAKSIITGVTEIIDKFSTVIVLEDDLETSPDFLTFMNQGLERYRNENAVMQISGHMFDVSLPEKTDAIFLPFTTSWGWSTWKRAWDYFDPAMKGYIELKKDQNHRHRFDLEGSYEYFNMLEQQLRGEIDSWAIRWYLSVFRNNGLTLFPSRTMVGNIGFDGSGTHCGRTICQDIDLTTRFSGIRDFKFPEINIDEKVYSRVCNYLAGINGTSRHRKKTLWTKIFPCKILK